jgi:hypothetical protein
MQDDDGPAGSRRLASCHGVTLAIAPSILVSSVLEPQVECACDHADHMTGNLAVLTSMFGGLGVMP